MKITVLIISLLLFLACSKSKPEPQPCDGTAKGFTADVNPVIQTHCNQPGCHASGSVNGPGPITNYAQVFNARSVIREAIRTGLMPQNSTLSTEERNKIICWIDSGAPEN